MKYLIALGATLAIAVGLTLSRNSSNRAAESVSLSAVSPVAKPNQVSAISALPERIDFQTQIWPLWESHCIRCHGKDRAEARLRLDLPSAILPEPLLVPGDSSKSELLRRLKSQEAGYRMPPEVSLSTGEMELIRRWIDEGAYRPPEQPELSSDWNSAERSHWSFQPLRVPEIPEVSHANWIRNPVDAFILARLEREGLFPTEPATPEQLIRRLSYGVTGLPPSLEDQHDYQLGEPDTIDRFVDELLSRTGYGEHFASFWLDLARYADTNGYEDDGVKPLAWQYRDFVIRSFNADRRFDRFTAMQIAGDLYETPSQDDFIATGFLRLGVWDSEPNDPLEARYEQLDDIVASTTSVFLGLTMECARCHDHPEEPISIRDYYRFAAVFQTLERPVNGRLEETIPSATATQLVAAEEAQQLQLHLQRQALLEVDDSRAIELRARAASVMQDFQFPHAYRWKDTRTSPRNNNRVLLRGNPHTPGEFVQAGPPAILTSSAFNAETHPRLQLATWLTTETRSLLARVIVNRVWSWHFGRGLTNSTSNLGVSGDPPTHPQLLEWLAAWFVQEADWSLKKLHRLILTSNTYRTSRAGENPRREVLYGSFSRRRLRAEEIYDAILSISGKSSDKRYGPPFYPSLSSEVLGTLAEPGRWNRSEETGRRAIYAVVKRTLPYPMFEAFDAPAASRTCAIRPVTHSVNQALVLWNSRFVEVAARNFAKRIVREAGSEPQSQIDFAFQTALGRLPDDWERARYATFLEEDPQRSPMNTEELTPLTQMCLVLFNLNEFAFLE